MIAPSARMISPGPYNRQKLRKLHFLMTDNNDLVEQMRGHRHRADAAVFAVEIDEQD